MANAGIYYGRPSTIHKIDFTDSSVTQSTAFSAAFNAFSTANAPPET